jgi:N-acetylglutamate synthase-like GNAT family acetyltransferase
VATRPIRIRAAVLEDADAIGETHAEAWTAAYDHIFERAFLNGAAESRRIGWRLSLPDLLLAPNVVLVAEHNGTVIGFAHANPETSDPFVGEIHAFYVHPDQWGSGVADSLMRQTCNALAADSQDVVLWTLRDAQRARHFYQKANFRTTGKERSESLSDWTSGTTVDKPAVQYAKTLAPQRITRQT